MKRRLFIGFTLSLALCAVYSLMIAQPAKVSAAPEDDIRGATLRWINRAKIEVTAGSQKFLFFDRNIGDTDLQYLIQNYACTGGNAGDLELERIGGSGSGVDTSHGELDLDLLPGTEGGGCIDEGGARDKPISNQAAANIIFALNGDTISRVDNDKDWVYKRSSSDPNLYMRVSEEGEECQDRIIVSGSTYEHYELTTGGGNDPPDELDVGSCSMPASRGPFPPGMSNSTSYPLGTASDTQNPPGTSAPGDNGFQEGEGDQNVTCETSGNPLTWVMCPIFNGVADAADWIFKNFIQRYLVVNPIRASSDDPSFQVWSSFRVYGNILLVILMLVIVFGQTIGGGLVDAYTAKKTLPRIFVAAILINLSIYIVNFMIDVSNIIGGGLGEVMLAPLRASGQMSFQMDAGQSLVVLGVGFLGILLSGATIGGIIMATITSTTGGAFGALVGKAALFLVFSVLIPAVLAIIAVFVTLILRQGIILLLILVSPIAFALYCLPNTEKYFQKWWDLLFKTLMAYPVIIAIFAVADLLAVAALNAGGMQANESFAATVANEGFSDPLAAMIAFILQFLPLFLIPFAFKIAGGALGALHGAISGGTAKVNGMAKSRREHEKKRLQRDMTAARLRGYNNLGAAADRNRGTMRGRGYTFLKNRIGGSDMFLAAAEQQAEAIKEQEATTGAGIDDERRALTVNKAWALANDANGGTHWRMNDDGTRSFRTLGGRWVSETAVDSAHSRWDGDQFALQAATSYEMQKATTQEQQDYLYANFGRLAERGSGFSMNGSELGGLWTGAAFAKQNSDRQWKHYSWDSDSNRLQMNGLQMMQEIDERQGNWAMTSQHADTWTTMSEEINRSKQALAAHDSGTETLSADALAHHKETIQRGARIARSLGSPIMDENGQPIPGTASTIGQGASGRTKEEMENFAALFEEGDYVREYATERRHRPGARPGDAPTTPGLPLNNTPQPPSAPPQRPTSGTKPPA